MIGFEPIMKLNPNKQLSPRVLASASTSAISTLHWTAETDGGSQGCPCLFSEMAGMFPALSVTIEYISFGVRTRSNQRATQVIPTQP